MVARQIISQMRDDALARIQAYAEKKADESPEVSERIQAVRDVKGRDELHTQLFRLQAIADLLDAIEEAEGREAVVPENKPTPAARAKAEELGVDLDEVEGTGKGGRITVGDVEDHAKADPENDAGDSEEEDSDEVQAEEEEANA